MAMAGLGDCDRDHMAGKKYLLSGLSTEKKKKKGLPTPGFNHIVYIDERSPENSVQYPLLF